MRKKILSLFLSVMICLQGAAVCPAVYAEENVISEETAVAEDDLTEAVFPEETAEAEDAAADDAADDAEELTGEGETETTASGQCGDHACWKLEEEGDQLALTIYGSGDTYNYGIGPDERAPWKDYTDSITILRVEEGITGIGDFAFADCSSLLLVDLPATLTALGTGCFRNCSSLAGIALPEKVTVLNDGVFENCTELAEVAAEGAVASIGDHAFADSGLQKFKIPDTVRSIGQGAFRGCSRLWEITVPASLTSVADTAFLGCDALEKICFQGSPSDWNGIDIESMNEPLKEAELVCCCCGEEAVWSLTPEDGGMTLTISGYGLMYNYAKASSAPWYSSRWQITKLVIDSGIKYVGANAFCNLPELKQVILPNSVTDYKYGKNAFRNCSSLSAFLLVSDSAEETFRAVPEYLSTGETGETPEPAVTIDADGVVLQEDIDYSLAYFDNQAGQGLITITFTGGYSSAGRFVLPFVITAEGGETSWGAEAMGFSTVKEKAQEAYEAGTLTGRTVVAVIDSGINTSHEIFDGRVHPASTSVLDASGSYEDVSGHGTQVAGIIAENTPENVQLLIIKAFNAENHATADKVAAAVDYAVRAGADIINLSFSVSKEKAGEAEYTEYVNTLEEHLSAAYSAGCLLVCSAGNNGTDLDISPCYPACSAYTIPVSALTENRELWENSNYGSAVMYAAPGAGLQAAAIGTSSSYSQAGGTSLAAAYISAAFALLKLYYPDAQDFSGSTALPESAVLSGSAGLSDNAAPATGQEYLCSLLTGICEDLGEEGTDRLYGCGMPVFSEGVVPGETGEPEEIPADRPEITGVRFGTDWVTLSWNGPQGFTYSVYRRAEDEDEFTLAASGQKGTYRDEDLHYPVKYYYYIETEYEGFYTESRRSETVCVWVRIPVVSVQLAVNGHDLYCTEGSDLQLKAHFNPEWATIRTGAWSSSDTDVLTVDSTGRAHGVSAGSAEVTFIADDGGQSAAVTVHVTPAQQPDCGENAHWALEGEEGNYTLVLYGEGPTYYFPKEQARPWEEYVDEITTVIAEEGITGISEELFLNHKNLETVQLPDSLRAIEADAFTGCHKLASLALPKGVTGLDCSAFYGCPGLTELSADEENSVFSSEGGRLFSKDRKELIYCPLLCSDFRIPEGTEKIGPFAFYQNKCISELKCPASLAEIAENAFDTCRKLTDIYIPGGMHTVGKNAFHYCSSLRTIHYGGTPAQWKQITIREGNEYLKKAAVIFGSSTDLENGLTWSITGPAGDCTLEISGSGAIGDYASESAAPWYGCREDITKIVIGKGVTRIGANAFYRYPELKEVVLPSGEITFGKNAFRACGQLELFKVPLGASGSADVSEKAGDSADGSYAAGDAADKSGGSESTGTVGTETAISGTSAVYLEITPQYLTALYDAKSEAYQPGVTITCGGETLTEGSDYTLSWEQNTGVGQGLICLAFAGEYAPAGTVRLPFTICSELLGGDVIRRITSMTMAKTVFTYDGFRKEPSLTVRSSTAILRKGTDYRVEFSASPVNAGTYTVTVRGNGFTCTGTLSRTFTIKPAVITPRVVLSASSFVWRGRAVRPSVKVCAGSRQLGTSSYKVTYAPGRKNVGKYRVDVDLKGNYSGSKTVYFRIVPKATAIRSLASGRGYLGVSWKAGQQTTGYQVQIATNSSFTKNSRLAGSTGTSRTIKNLQGGKRYFVRIRAYKLTGGIRYYSVWSKVRSVMVRK